MAYSTVNTIPSLQLVERVSKIFSLDGKKFEARKKDDIIKQLMKSSLIMKLKECNEKIAPFEGKYARGFEQFAKDWKQNNIVNKYKYQIEGDFIDWEALELLKKDILKLLFEF